MEKKHPHSQYFEMVECEVPGLRLRVRIHLTPALSPLGRGEGERRLQCVRPVCATLEEPKAEIPQGALARLNPRLLKR